MRKFFVALALVTLVGQLVSAQNKTDSSPAYKFQSIDFPGATLTQVFGINERGDVVGCTPMAVEAAMVSAGSTRPLPQSIFRAPS